MHFQKNVNQILKNKRREEWRREREREREKKHESGRRRRWKNENKIGYTTAQKKHVTFVGWMEMWYTKSKEEKTTTFL